MREKENRSMIVVAINLTEGAEQRMQQDVLTDRLWNDAVSMGLKCLADEACARIARDQNHRQEGVERTNDLQRLQARQLRHVDVEHRHMYDFVTHDFQRLFAVLGQHGS